MPTGKHSAAPRQEAIVLDQNDNRKVV